MALFAPYVNSYRRLSRNTAAPVSSASGGARPPAPANTAQDSASISALGFRLLATIGVVVSLAAMGALTHGNVRVSLPVGVEEADVVRFLDELPGVVARVRAALGATDL